MKHYTFRFFIFLSLLAGVFFIGRAANAATLFMYPAEQQVEANETFSVDVRLDGKLQPINVVKATLTYTKNILDVESVDYRGSFLTLWPELPSVNREAGTISFTGGIPHGSYVIGGRVVTVTFKAKTQGLGTVSFDEAASSVLLNDSKGTKSPLDSEGGTYFVVEALQESVSITSSTHPDEDIWYPLSTVRLSWEQEPDALYSYVLSKSPFEVPDNNAESELNRAEFTDVDDGAYYFILKRQYTGKDWVVVGRRKVLVDRTAPAHVEYKIGRDTLAFGGKYFLAFSASDYASGLDRVEVIENGKKTENTISPYVLTDQARTSELILRFIDRAGNVNEVVIQNSAISKKIPWATLIIVSIILVIGGIVMLWMRKRKKEEPVQ